MNNDSMGITEFLQQREAWLANEVGRLAQLLEETKGSLLEVRRMRAVVKVEPAAATPAPVATTKGKRVR